MEKSEYEGSWWLPSNPSTIIPGSIHFETNGIRLKLLGSFIHPSDFRPKLIPLILGDSVKGKITLYGCIQTHSRFGTGLTTSSFSIAGVLVGAHFQKPEDVVFGGFSVTFPQLHDWIGTSGVTLKRPDKQTLMISEKEGFLVTANVPEAKISIGFKFSEHNDKDEVSVRYVPYAWIEMTKEIPLKKCLDLLYRLGTFFSLAVSGPIYPDSIDGLTETVKFTLENPEKSFRLPIEILYEGVNWGRVRESINWRGMLFDLNSIRDQFESLLKNWFNKIELLEPIYDMYFGTMYNPHMFLQQKFLSLIQGVESYHRRVFDGFESPPADHKERLQDILEVVPDKHKDWLQNELSDSNELSLKKRLEELVATYAFLGFDAEFVEKVRNARNYLTHFDENKKKYARPDELFVLTRKLRGLTESILLTELGLTLTQVEPIMKRIESLRAAEFHIYDF